VKTQNATYPSLEKLSTAYLMTSLADIDRSVADDVAAWNDREFTGWLSEEARLGVMHDHQARKRKATMIRRELGRRRRLGIA
jgi:hypothetical protein